MEPGLCARISTSHQNLSTVISAARSMCPAIPAAATSDAPALVLAQCRHNRRQHDNWFGAFTFPMVSADSVRKDQLIVMTFSRQGIGGEEKLPFLPPLPEHP